MDDEIIELFQQFSGWVNATPRPEEPRPYEDLDAALKRRGWFLTRRITLRVNPGPGCLLTTCGEICSGVSPPPGRICQRSWKRCEVCVVDDEVYELLVEWDKGLDHPGSTPAFRKLNKLLVDRGAAETSLDGPAWLLIDDLYRALVGPIRCCRRPERQEVIRLLTWLRSK